MTPLIEKDGKLFTCKQVDSEVYRGPLMLKNGSIVVYDTGL